MPARSTQSGDRLGKIFGEESRLSQAWLRRFGRLVIYTTATRSEERARIIAVFHRNCYATRMTSTLQSFHVRQPIAVWLRRLLPIAQTNRHFNSEDQTLTIPTNQAWPTDTAKALESVSNAQTPAVFGQNFAATEHVLRMAVMVAIADDAHALCDDEILFHYYQSLGLTTDVLDTICTLSEMPSVEPAPQQMMVRGVERSIPSDASPQAQRSVLQSLRDWLDSRAVPNPKVAHVLCKLIPSQCPFERDIHLFGRTIAHIPPLCKLNPLYDQLVGLRFRALSYLADECGEDISSYC